MIFYRCSKCKNTWQYPIPKCPNCFSKLERILSKKIKVRGISKVTIPTILHPKVPYFVLVLEDEEKRRWVQKSIKEYKIGEEFKIEKNERKDTVAIWRVKYDIETAIETIFGLISPLKVNQATKILILPTLTSPKHPYFAENTNPQVLDSLIKYLVKIGAKSENIKVAGQSFDEIPIEASAQKSGVLKICSKNKTLPLDLAKTNFLKKEKDNLPLEISEEVLKTDLLINLPILKLDSKFKIKGALFNTTKLLKKESYLSLKYLYSEEEIIEKLQDILPEYLTVADGIFIQKTTGFTTFLGILLASFNSFHLDWVFAKIAMIKDLPEYLKRFKIEDIPTAGREIEEIQYDIERVGT